MRRISLQDAKLRSWRPRGGWLLHYRRVARFAKKLTLAHERLNRAFEVEIHGLNRLNAALQRTATEEG